MLFLLRSTVCIGLVASALPDHAVLASLGGDPAAGAAALADLCRADVGRCRTIAGAALAAEPAQLATPRKLRDQPATGASRLPRPAEVL